MPVFLAGFLCLDQGSGWAAGGDGFIFAGEDREEIKDADHLEGLGGEGRRIDELGVAPDLARASQSAYDGADAGGVDVVHLFQIENQIETLAGDGLIQGRVELGGIGGLERAFDAKSTDGAGLPNVEIQGFLLEEDGRKDDDSRMIGTLRGSFFPEEHLLHSPFTEIRLSGLCPSSMGSGLRFFCTGDLNFGLDHVQFPLGCTDERAVEHGGLFRAGAAYCG